MNTKHLQDCEELPNEISFSWHITDVIDRAISEHNIKFSRDTARWILRSIESQYDCGDGVTWDTLDYWINQYADDAITD